MAQSRWKRHPTFPASKSKDLFPSSDSVWDLARMARHGFSRTLVVLTLTVIALSYSRQPLALQHSPRLFAKFASSTTSSSSSPQFDYHYETRFFQQQLDHFSFSDLPTFPQRYLINTDHWLGPQHSGPIFFYCGNEGDIVWFAQNTGFLWELAPSFGAMIVFPEVSVFLSVWVFCYNLKTENYVNCFGFYM